MNILFDNIVFELQRFGGISRHWAELLKYCMGVDDELRLSYIEGPTAASNHFRNSLDLSPADIGLDRNLPLAIRRYLRVKSDKGAIFHSSYFRVSTNLRHRQVTTIHDLIYEKFARGLKRSVHMAQKKYSIQHADKIICVSENTKRDLLEHYPAVDCDKVIVIANGAGPEFHPLKLASDDVSIRGNSFQRMAFVLFVGSRNSYKNFDIALDLVASDQARARKLTLVVVGGGNPKPHELKKIARRNIGDHVHFMTDVSTAELNVLYNAAFCLIYPSKYEGFGIPPLEAMRAGCPVLTSNTSSIPEVVGNAAIMCDPTRSEEFIDQLDRLGQNPDRQRLIDAGQLRASQFSWDETFRKTVSVYRSLM